MFLTSENYLCLSSTIFLNVKFWINIIIDTDRKSYWYEVAENNE